MTAMYQHLSHSVSSPPPIEQLTPRPPPKIYHGIKIVFLYSDVPTAMKLNGGGGKGLNGKKNIMLKKMIHYR